MKPPSTHETLGRIQRFESPNITQLDEGERWPVAWERARGCDVWDAEGTRYLDLTAAFGVAAAGHANPRVVAAGRRQMGRLLHGMGDVHPHGTKGLLLEELSRRTFGRWLHGGEARSILACTGSDAVEAALKTALLATGRRRVIAFEGGYHGTGYGALNATHREHFKRQFIAQLGGFASFAPWPGEAMGDPADMAARVARVLDAAAAGEPVGAVLMEPVQARGGIRVPAPGFLAAVRAWCDRRGALLVLDEIYTGFGRAGRWFACDREGVVPDVVCVGKALSGGFPIAACVGRSDLMTAAWPKSDGEAIHTSTFLGHPVGCAMALAQMREIEERGLVERADVEGRWLRTRLEEMSGAHGHHVLRAVGVGLMAGIEVRTRDGLPAGGIVVRVVQRLAREGILVLPEGADAEVLSLTPPLTIPRRRLSRALESIGRALREACA